MRGLDGKTAIVAGGATLIGQGVAEALAGYGCNVVIADINVPDGEAAAKSSAARPVSSVATFAATPTSQRSSKQPSRRPAGSTIWSTWPVPTSTTAPKRRAPTG